MSVEPKKNLSTLRRRLSGITTTSDANFIEILRHSLNAFMILGGATALQFIFDLFLAQRYGAQGYGVFYLCFSVMMILALLGRLGLDRAVVRFIPAYLSEGRKEAAQGVSKASIESSLYLTIPTALLLFLSSDLLATNVFNDPTISPYLKTFAFAIPAFALSYIYSGILKSLKRTTPSLFLERISVYFVGIFSVLLLPSDWGIEAIVTAFTVACWGTAIAGAYLTHKYLSSNKQLVPFSKRRLLLISAPLLFVMFATQMNGQASVLLLGSLASQSEVGIFNVALKISMLMSIVLAAITTISGTTISELYHTGRKKELEMILSKTSALAAVAALPLLLLMTVFPDFLLGLFGKEFLPGHTTLILLGVAQYINAVLGASIFALGLTGKERQLALVVGASLIVNVAIGAILIPPLGVLGAGIATSFTIAFSNILLVLLVKKLLGVWLLPFSAIATWVRMLTSKR